jgi:phage tail sheath protein FI
LGADHQNPSDATLTPNDYERTETNTTGNKKGLTAFAEIKDISIIYSPNALEKGIHSTLINHCENLKNRFAILDCKQTGKPEKPTDSKYAAFYYPWINIVNPVTGALLLLPPGGHIAGIYARTDTERGVHKAPANEIIKGADSPQFMISKATQDLLNPQGINCIRLFSGTGIRVWGARTMSNDPLWKYINVRRLLIFLEGSILQGTQWVVFEPNNEKLWARVNQTISQFLTTVWKNGALMGNTPREAFFVKCDRTTMTQDDIDNGRLIVLIGVAPSKPAEFVIFRIAQWAGGSAATE